jgi:CoA:oxalate CoA-transferase
VFSDSLDRTWPSTAPVAGLRVIDISDHISGQVCGRYLAEYGADVALVEPRPGTATRRLGPFRRGEADLGSLLFEYLNSGKQLLTLDREQAAYEEHLRSLLATADVLICEPADGHRIARASEHLVVCAISDFPAAGRYSSWRGTEMIHQALSGSMYQNGDPEREPLYGVGYRAYYSCGTTALITILAALVEREISGRGQLVSATVFESCAAMAQNLGTFFAYNGSWPRRGNSGQIGVVECTDGWIVMVAGKWEAACRALGADELIDHENYATPEARQDRWNDIWNELAAKARNLSCDDVVEAGQRYRLLVERMSTLEQLTDLGEGGIALTTDSPGETRVKLGPPFLFVGENQTPSHG